MAIPSAATTNAGANAASFGRMRPAAIDDVLIDIEVSDLQDAYACFIDQPGKGRKAVVL